MNKKLATIAFCGTALAAGCGGNGTDVPEQEAAVPAVTKEREAPPVQEMAEEREAPAAETAGEQEAADSMEALKAESMAVIQEFLGSLQGELQDAMRQGGPHHAIGVCNEVAPAIAEQQSAATGWSISRTSLRLRNPDSAPDAWETEVLESFEARKAAGEEVGPMAHAEIVEQDGQPFFRFMKAIPTADTCLACHGGEQQISNVKPRLNELYPDDNATGFSVGDIRGAITLIRPL